MIRVVERERTERLASFLAQMGPSFDNDSRIGLAGSLVGMDQAPASPGRALGRLAT
jgi:hypothetical protein